MPETVSATLSSTGRLGIEAEEAADLTWEAPGGATVSLRLDYLTRPSRRTMRASGELGTIELDLIRHRIVVELAGEAPRTLDVEQSRDAMMKDQTSAFLAAVSGGDAGELATLDDGARALAICDAARLSSAEGSPRPVRDWRIS
jgi:predicted dehydrogenase